MKKNLAAFIGSIFTSCLFAQHGIAVNGIENTPIIKEQSELVFSNTKTFPNNTQLSIAIIKNGEAEFMGVIRTNDTLQLTENQERVFEIGSITKVFTASLLAHLVHQQKIKLDDPIQKYLNFQLPIDREITFLQLANHTSGLPRLPTNLDLLMVDPENPYVEYDTNKLTQYLQQEIKLNQDPGTTYEYSNLGAGILGFQLAMISNTSYEALLKEHLFIPYSMTNSTSQRENIKSDVVKGLNPDGNITSHWDFDALAGGGAIFSTVEDLSKFAFAQFDAKNTELTHTHKSTFQINENLAIGLGWHILKRLNGDEVIWHNGGTGGYSSSMALDVKNKNGIIILSNVSAFHEHMHYIEQLCFGLLTSLDEK